MPNRGATSSEMPADLTDLFGTTGHFGIPIESDVVHRSSGPAERRVDNGTSRGRCKTLGDNQEDSRPSMLALAVWRVAVWGETPLDRPKNLPTSCKSLIRSREGTGEQKFTTGGKQI